jgi:hypothetical protein
MGRHHLSKNDEQQWSAAALAERGSPGPHAGDQRNHRNGEAVDREPDRTGAPGEADRRGGPEIV